MSSVEFENQSMPPYKKFDRLPKGLTALLLKTGVVKNEKQATVLFLIIILLALGYIGFYIFHNSATSIIPQEKIKQIDQTKFLST